MGHWIAGNAAVAVAAVSAMIAAISAIFAVQTYRRNANTKRAEFLLQLHKAFFVDSTYKTMRNLLDDTSEAAQERLLRNIEDEAYELTDFLNFFELIAYFQCCGTLLGSDVDALLSYYLDLLKSHRKLFAYIGKSQTSFEYLNGVLRDRCRR